MKNYTDREINDLNRNIQSAQMRLNDIFATIGRTYYNENSGNPQGAYVQMFADLKATEEQIEQMNTRIKFLNGVVVCTKCKSDNSVNSAFCSVCGTRLPHTFASDGANRCKNCGNVINPGQMFCGSCGAKVESAVSEQQTVNTQQPDFLTSAQTIAQSEPPVQPEPTAQPEPPVQPEPTAQPEPAVQPEPPVQPEPVIQQRVCPNCGTPIKADDALFCAECGTRL